MISDGYDRFAWYYEQSHADFNDDLDFFLNHLNGPPLQVLECGCGSGRLLIPLAQDGHHCWGIDRSQAMLDLAIEKSTSLEPDIAGRLHFTNADMTQFSLPQSFDVVIIPHNTLMHLAGDHWIDCLISIHRHLKPRGKLIIDLTNPFHLLALEDQPDPVVEKSWIDPRDQKEVEQASQFWLCEEKKRLTLTWSFRKPGDLPAKMTTTYTIRLPHELELGLNQGGFRLQQQFGGYLKEPFHENSTHLILEATRPKR